MWEMTLDKDLNSHKSYQVGPETSDPKVYQYSEGLLIFVTLDPQWL